MKLGIAVPERHVKKDVLDAALEATTRLDESMIEHGAPTFDEAGHRVQWKPEPPNQENFDHVGKILPRGWADCDDLAPWHAASLRHTGEDPGARAEVYKSGPKRWHAVVKRSDGSIDDPSAWRGMHEYRGGPGVTGGAIMSPLGNVGSSIGGPVGAYTINPALAARPLRNGQWEARADLPWNFIPWNREPAGMNDLDVAMAALHTAPVANQAIAGAAKAASRLAELHCATDPDWCADYFEAIAWAHDGADFDEIADEFGEDIAEAVEDSVSNLWGNIAVGAFRPFRGIARAAKAVARPVAKAVSSPLGKTVMSVVPGFQGAMMLKGASAAAKAAKGGGDFGDIAKGFGGGALRGGLNWAKASPALGPAAKMMGMNKALEEAKKIADKAADALEDTPKIARRAGVPKLEDTGLVRAGKKVRRIAPGGGIREVIIRA